MEMKRFAAISFFVAAAFVGCAKLGSEAVETVPSEEQAENTPFIIRVDTPVPEPSATKTTFNEETYEVNWSAGDALAVRINGSETTYEFVNKTGETNEFTCADFHPEDGIEYEYDILYPYSKDGVYTLAGGIKTPMYGKATAVGSNQPNVRLQQLSGIIKLTIKNENAIGTATLTDLKIERTDGGILGGKHTYDRATGKSVPTKDAVIYTMVGGQNKQIPAGESIAMCLQCAPFAGTVGTGLKITYKVNGTEYTETRIFKKDIEFAAGKVNKTSVTFAETQCVMEGTAVANGVQLMTKCLEKKNLYAFRADLSEGDFQIRLTGENGGIYAPVSGNDINDGKIAELTENAEGHWTVSSAGTYRVVVDFEDRTVAIYSPDTDEVVETATTWKNTTVSPTLVEKTVISNLWMWGDFASDAFGNKGSDKYMLTSSLANPRVFIYYKNGETLPRGGNATVKFMVSSILNNVYAYGASTTRDKHVKTELGVKVTNVYGGQGDNRYSRWIIPENTNYIEVFIGSKDKETVNGAIVTAEDAYVLFDKR